MKTIGKWLGIVVLGLVVLGLCGCKSTPTARPFITKWQGAAGSPLYIPIVGTYTLTWYNEATPDERHTEQVSVMTEEAEGSQYSSAYVINPYTITPPTDGVYVVEAGPEGVEGMLMLFDLSEMTAPNLLTVEQFGDVVWKQLTDAFNGCFNMQFAKGIDTPNLSQCTSLAGMFSGCEAFDSPLAQWDVSQVTAMNRMFNRCLVFNQPLEKWDVSKVENMESMFNFCESFNQPLDRWNVGRVTNMEYMFLFCFAFNQPLNSWNVSQVTNMSQMFDGCTSFKQSLDAWDIGNVSKEYGMVGIFNDSPTDSLSFTQEWRAAGYNLAKGLQ